MVEAAIDLVEATVDLAQAPLHGAEAPVHLTEEPPLQGAQIRLGGDLVPPERRDRLHQRGGNQ